MAGDGGSDDCAVRDADEHGLLHGVPVLTPGRQLGARRPAVLVFAAAFAAPCRWRAVVPLRVDVVQALLLVTRRRARIVAVVREERGAEQLLLLLALLVVEG